MGKAQDQNPPAHAAFGFPQSMWDHLGKRQGEHNAMENQLQSLWMQGKPLHRYLYHSLCCAHMLSS